MTEGEGTEVEHMVLFCESWYRSRTQVMASAAAIQVREPSEVQVTFSQLLMSAPFCVWCNEHVRKSSLFPAMPGGLVLEVLELS